MSRMIIVGATEAVACPKRAHVRLSKAVPRALYAPKSALTHICVDGRNAA